MKLPFSIVPFAVAAVMPGLSLIAGAVVGGIWPLIALLTVTVVITVLDVSDMKAQASNDIANSLPQLLGALHFGTLLATLWAVGQPNHLDFGQTAALVVAMGLFAGQVSNAVAHELIHRPERAAHRFGTAIYCSLLNGQHVSAHLLLHHPFAGTRKDPCSAPVGRSYYRFALHAALAEFMEGWRAETARRGQQTQRPHPYLLYLGGALASLLVAWWVGQLAAVVALLLIALHAQSQLLLSDYVQHYGLRRKLLPSGKPEPMGPQHSWNTAHAFSGAMMLNAPRHSDHHMQPARRFPDLRLDAATMPMLPYPLPVMGTLALVPPLWRRVMDPRVRIWMSSTQSAASNPPAQYKTAPLI